MVYVNPDISTDWSYMSHNNAGVPYNSPYKGYSTQSVSTDEYSSAVYISNYSKTFTAMEAIRNYVDFHLWPVEAVGDVQYDYGTGSFDLPAGGHIELPPYSFGSHSGSVYLGVRAGYLHPTINDYAAMLPCYPMTDQDNKRWFLQSYGMYKMIPVSGEVADAALDFNRNVNVEMKVPIPAYQQNTAPDSIGAYTLKMSNVWTLAGYAHRSGANYVKQLTTRGVWNFAVPVPGVYVTVKLRTTDSTAVYNTRLKIKSGDEEIADVRTNSSGDAKIFVPVGKALTYEVINDHFNSWSPIVPTPQALGSFSKAGEKIITLPERIDHPSFTASVYNCDGTPMKSGLAVLTSINARDKYVFPFENGAFRASAWINAGYDLAEIAILDPTGQVLSNNRVIFGSALSNSWEQETKKYTLTYYGCQDAQQVFCNYEIDGVAKVLKGPAGSLPLTMVQTPVGGVINVGTASNGFILQGWVSSILGNYIVIAGAEIPTGIKVNGEDCTLDGHYDFAITRQDGTRGFTEGWFLINYKDPSGKKHQMNGTFRVKNG